MGKRLCIILAALALCACGDGRSAAGGDSKNVASIGDTYPILDSGFGSHDQRVYWLDNRRVIFYGYEGQKPKTVDEQKLIKHGIFIWDTQTNTVVKHADAKDAFCYGDGYIFYYLETRNDDPEHAPYGTAHWKEGLIGEEKKYSSVRETKPSDYQTIRNQFTCRQQDRPAEMQNRVWIPLREGDGYLDLGTIGPHNNDVPNAVLTTASNKPIPLPFSRNDIGTTSIRYYAFKNGYFLWQHVFGQPVVEGVVQQDRREIWMQTGCLTGWWVLPNGESENICIPSGPWTLGAVAVIPAREGLFIISKQKGKSGAYLSRADTALKLIEGYVDGAALSPDGCLMAFSHAVDLEAMRVGSAGQRTLKLLNLCTKS
jgi:hypothetical protein